MSVTDVAGGVDPGEEGVAVDSRLYRAVSNPVATSDALDGAIRCCGGATTVGPIWSFSWVASIDDSRRVRPAVGGTIRDGADMAVA